MRSHGGQGDHTLHVEIPAGDVRGVLFWRRNKTADPWKTAEMRRTGGALEAELPHQPPAGKLQYRVELSRGNKRVQLPPGDPIVIRFRGDVPLPVLILHIITIFWAMLMATRAGLEAIADRPRIETMVVWTVGLMLVGGLILGPVVQKYAFGAYWTGWPFGHDLTDNKTALAFAAWVAAWVALKRSANPRRWVVGAAVVTLLVFLVPHSVLGSELDYSKTS